MVLSIPKGLQMKRRFSEEKIIAALRETEGSGTIKEVCRMHNETEQGFFIVSSSPLIDITYLPARSAEE